MRLVDPEQQVANYKFDFIARLRTLVKRQGLDVIVVMDTTRSMLTQAAAARPALVTLSLAPFTAAFTFDGAPDLYVPLRLGVAFPR